MILGVDIGTQSLKVVACDNALAVRGEASQSYGVDHPRPGWAQQDPADWDRALGVAIAGALDAAGAGPGEVTAIGIAGQLDGCVAVGADATARGPCLIWMDRRAESELPDLPAAFSDVTGLVPDAGHMAAKIRWLERHAMGLDGTRFHQPVSYMVERLTGEYVFDHALASTTMLYSLATRDFDPALLSAFGVSRDRVPRIAGAADLAGRVHAAGSALAGVPVGTPVAVGTGDDFASPLGAGLVSPGPVVCVVGTAEVVGALSAQRVVDADRLVETHGYVTDHWFVENPGWLSGGAMTWLRGLFGGSWAELDRMAGDVETSEGITFIPALTGAMAPEWIASARGCFYGLTPAHGRGHLIRAVMEGCAFAMRDVIDRLDALGVPADPVWLLGGGARSALWAQIRADVAGRPVRVAPRIDTCPLGAAMLGAVAAGVHDDLAECAALVTGAADVITEPRSSDTADAAYHRYRVLFDALRPVFFAPDPAS